MIVGTRQGLAVFDRGSWTGCVATAFALSIPRDASGCRARRCATGWWHWVCCCRCRAGPHRVRCITVPFTRNYPFSPTTHIRRPGMAQVCSAPRAGLNRHSRGGDEGHDYAPVNLALGLPPPCSPALHSIAAEAPAAVTRNLPKTDAGITLNIVWGSEPVTAPPGSQPWRGKLQNSTYSAHNEIGRIGQVKTGRREASRFESSQISRQMQPIFARCKRGPRHSIL